MISIYSTMNFLAMFIMGCLALIMHVGNKSETIRAYSRYVAVNAIWALFIGILLFVDPNELHLRTLILRICYWLGFVIASTYFYFSLTYPNREPEYHGIRRMIFWLNTSLFFVYVFTNAIVETIGTAPKTYEVVTQFGPLAFPLFNILYSVFVLAALSALFKTWQQESDTVLRKQHGLLFLSAIVDFIPATIVAVLLPIIGTFTFSWSAPPFTVIWVVFVFYLIYQKMIFKIRIPSGLLLLLALLAILFLNIFIGEVENEKTREQISAGQNRENATHF